METVKRFREWFLDILFLRNEEVVQAEKVPLHALLAIFKPETIEGKEWITSLLPYRNKSVSNVIKALKYHRHIPSAGLLSEVLHEYLVEHYADETLLGISGNPPLLIPIPISSQKKEKRGYNQVEIILREMFVRYPNHQFAYSFEILFSFTKDVAQAHTLNKALRAKNVHGQFYVRGKEKIEGRSIILIDDVATTGATLAEAKRTLLDAGAAHVEAIALAH